MRAMPLRDAARRQYSKKKQKSSVVSFALKSMCRILPVRLQMATHPKLTMSSATQVAMQNSSRTVRVRSLKTRSHQKRYLNPLLLGAHFSNGQVDEAVKKLIHPCYSILAGNTLCMNVFCYFRLLVHLWTVSVNDSTKLLLSWFPTSQTEMINPVHREENAAKTLRNLPRFSERTVARDSISAQEIASTI